MNCTFYKTYKEKDKSRLYSQLRTKITQSLRMNTGPHCWHSFTSRCKWVDLKFTLCVLCLDTLMLYLCWGLFSLQQKNLCLNGSALKVAPAAFNGLQTRLDPWLPSVPIPCIQMERNQPVWQFFCFDTEWVQSLHIQRFGIERSEQKRQNPFCSLWCCEMITQKNLLYSFFFSVFICIFPQVSMQW